MRLLMISGSTRRNSTNAAALQCVKRTAPPDSSAVTYRGLSDLPAFNPDDDTETPPEAVAHLRSDIAEADAILISTSDYAGTLPGSMKNLLDWTSAAPKYPTSPSRGSMSLRPGGVEVRSRRWKPCWATSVPD